MIKIVTLSRFFHGKSATVGALRVGDFKAYTIERPWMNNKINVSCIPTGVYVIRRGTFGRKYENFELQKVPDRTAIEMHVANFAADVRGCIGLGDDYIASPQNVMVKNSKNTFTAFMAAMSGIEEAVLHIVRGQS